MKREKITIQSEEYAFVDGDMLADGNLENYSREISMNLNYFIYCATVGATFSSYGMWKKLKDLTQFSERES